MTEQTPTFLTIYEFDEQEYEGFAFAGILQDAQSYAEELNSSESALQWTVSYTEEPADNVFDDPSRFVLDLSRDGSSVFRVEVAADMVASYLDSYDENYLVAVISTVEGM
ncbi:MAG: hypothetical protein HRT61_01090 [Ekhidna sp.]|nr:hypothetical protein [Ekhidna sp.]